jgi:hypothetical protein
MPSNRTKSSPKRLQARPAGNIVRLHADHPLVGIWVVADDDPSGIEFEVSPVRSGFAVAAHDPEDGERFVITGVSWDGTDLQFKLVVPSNGTRVEHCFRVQPDGTIEDTFTARYISTLRRKTAKPTERPDQSPAKALSGERAAEPARVLKSRKKESRKPKAKKDNKR